VSAQLVVSGSLALAGGVALAVAVAFERRMHGHRRPGVSYRAATFRLDGGWRRDDLFTPAGLAYQRRASRWALAGAALLVASLVAWVALGAA
jgi:hypothetical protein